MLDDTIDARTIAAVCVERLDEIEGNARPAPAVWNLLVAALPAAPPAPANVDDAFDGDDGGLLSAQPAALLLAESVPAAEAKIMLTFHGLCVGNPFAKNLMDVASISGFELMANSMASAASADNTGWACNHSVILFACTIWVLGCAWQQAQHQRWNLSSADVRVYGVRCCSVVA